MRSRETVKIRSIIKRAEHMDSQTYRRILLKKNYPPYWDDGLVYCNYGTRGFRSGRRKKRILNHQRRQFRTWKFNRGQQWF